MKTTVFLFGIAMALLTACQNSSNSPANQIDGTATIQDTVNLNQQPTNPADTTKANKEKGEKEEEKDGDD